LSATRGRHAAGEEGGIRIPAFVDVKGLSISYGAVSAVRNVSFRVNAGDVYGLIGPNGAGKTSIVETVAGLRSSTMGGSINMCGYDPCRNRGAVSRLLGIQLQESSYPSGARVGELCALYESIYRVPGGATALLESFGLLEHRKSLISSLSGGMRQRLALVLAQLGDVRVVVLDELTTGLDPEQRRETWESVRRLADRGVAVLLTSHHMDEVEALCSRVSVLLNGEVVAAGTPADLIVQHGGSTRFVIDTRQVSSEDVEALHGLGLQQPRRPHPGAVELAGQYPSDYRSIIDLLRSRGRSETAVRPRAATLEDAYLELVGRDTTVKVGVS